jgi:hypothetical protein
MKLLPFAKLFEINGGHMVVYKSYDVDEDKYQLSMMCSPEDGPDVTIVSGFPTEEKRDEAFEEYSQESAERFVNRVADVFKPSEEL